MKKFFSALWRGWKKFAHKLGIFNTYVILSICYWIVMLLAAIFPIILRKDLLDKRMPKKPQSMWKEHDPIEPTFENARRQF
jgi:hypothetical protein